MIKAYVRTMHYGYVVFAVIIDQNDNRDCMPLKCFGWYKSAAMEFRNFINHGDMTFDKLERQVKLWARNYDPSKLYTYPEINEKNTIVKLIQQ